MEEFEVVWSGGPRLPPRETKPMPSALTAGHTFTPGEDLYIRAKRRVLKKFQRSRKLAYLKQYRQTHPYHRVVR